MSLARKFAVFVAVLCSVPMVSQDASPNDKSNQSSQTVQSAKLSDYVGSPLERFALGLQYQYQYVEQPSSVLVTQPDKTQLLLQNPEHSLNQHSFTYDFGQVILTPAQLSRVRKLNPDFCSHDKKGRDAATCLARAGGGAKRFLSGLKVTGTISEHPVAVQGAILSAGYLVGGEVDFNPVNLFTTGTDWKAVTPDISETDKAALRDTLKSGSCSTTTPDAKDKEAVARDQSNTIKCAKGGLLAFQGPTRRTKLEAILYSVTPTFQYKRLTPFDFLRYAGTLIPSSSSGGLNSWSLTVDVRRLFASPTSRLDAIEAAKAIRPKTTAPVNPTKLCGLVFTGGSVSFLSVPRTTSEESCRETAKALKAEQYQLGCSAGKDTVLGPAEPEGLPVPASALPAPNNRNWDGI
jgi:hypothetical protein